MLVIELFKLLQVLKLQINRQKRSVEACVKLLMKICPLEMNWETRMSLTFQTQPVHRTLLKCSHKSIQSDQLDDSSLSQLPSTSGPSVHDANHLRMAEGSPNSSNILDDTQIVPSDATDVDSTDSGDRNLSFVQLEEPDITVNQTTSSNEIESKPVVVPLYEVHRANNEDILNQLEEWHVDYVDDDIEIIVSSKGYGGPLKTTLEGLVKLEKPDDFSGMIPYIITVSDF